MAQPTATQSFSYRQPECELSVLGKPSPLSQWLDQPIFTELQFNLTVADKQIKGNQQLLQELIIAVANYLDTYLSWQTINQPKWHHQISYAKWRKLEVTTLQLFDLNVVLEELASQCQLLPSFSLPAKPRPIWWSLVAILIASIGVTTWRITTPEPVPVISHAESQSEIPAEIPPVALQPVITPKPSVPLAKTAPPAPPQEPLNEAYQDAPQSPTARPTASAPPAPTPPQLEQTPSKPNQTPTPDVSLETRAIAPAPPAERSGNLASAPQITILKLERLTTRAPGITDSKDNYSQAIATLQPIFHKVTIPEGLQGEVPVILTVVELENQIKLWVRATPNLPLAVNQLLPNLQSVLNQPVNLNLPVGEYLLLLKVSQDRPLGEIKQESSQENAEIN